MALLGIIVLAGVGGCAKSKIREPGLPKPLAGSVRFTVVVPGAKQVFLAGSFNGWKKDGIPMNIGGGTALWWIDVPLQEGEYTFMYLIDGVRWLTPPSADDFVTDDFGQTNGVVIVR
jgi:1,4-alpha-glucan branching enzyme